jgi:hypothetical protein
MISPHVRACEGKILLICPVCPNLRMSHGRKDNEHWIEENHMPDRPHSAAGSARDDRA